VKAPKDLASAYGVERAIDLAYGRAKIFFRTSHRTRRFISRPIIHNPEVNDQIRNMASKSSRPSQPRRKCSSCNPGTPSSFPPSAPRSARVKKLEAKGCALIDTTCGDVMSVWKRVRQYSKENVTEHHSRQIVARGNQATSSQARAYGNGHYLVVFNLAETIRLQLPF